MNIDSHTSALMKPDSQSKCTHINYDSQNFGGRLPQTQYASLRTEHQTGVSPVTNTDEDLRGIIGKQGDQCVQQIDPTSPVVVSYKNPFVQGSRGPSVSIRILFSNVTSYGDITPFISEFICGCRQRKSRIRQPISAPSVPGCVCANNLSFETCVFQVVKSPHSCQDCYSRDVRTAAKAGSSLKSLKLPNW